MPLPIFDPATMTLVEVPGRREVELTINATRAEPAFRSADPQEDLSYTTFYDMTAEIPSDLNPAFYWAMVLSYVARVDLGAPHKHVGGLDALDWFFQYLDEDGEIPVRWWMEPRALWPEGVLDPRDLLYSASADPRHAPDYIQFPITSAGYGWGNVITQIGPPEVSELRNVPPPSVEDGSYDVYYEPGLTRRYFGRHQLFWRAFETGDNQAGSFYEIRDGKFEAVLRKRFGRLDISSIPPRPEVVRILVEHDGLYDPWRITIEDKRVIFIPYAGPSTVNPGLGPSGTVQKRRGVSGDRRR